MDHALFSVEASSFIKNVLTLHSGANLSDHLPLLFSRMSLLGMQRSLPSALQRRIAWYKASEEQSCMLEAVSQLVIPDQLVNCLDLIVQCILTFSIQSAALMSWSIALSLVLSVLFHWLTLRKELPIGTLKYIL